MLSMSIRQPASLLRFSSKSQLPMVLQTEAAECGLACLTMIAGFHGLKTDLTLMRQKYPFSAHGASLKHVMDIASNMHLSSRALKLDIADLPNLSTPCILHWEMKHFVVLKQCERDGIVIHDPALGERSVSLEEAGDCFTGVALELTPTTSFQPKEEKRPLTLDHFWSSIIGLKRQLCIVFLLSTLLQLFVVVSPYYMQLVIDDVVLRSDFDLLTVLALGFGLVLVLETLTAWLRQTTLLHLASKLSIQMSANVFHHLIRLPMEYFGKRHMGDIVSRFSSITTIREMLTTGIVTAIVDGLLALITLLVMFVYSVKLALVITLVVLLYAAIRLAFYRPIHRLNEAAIMANAKEQSHFMESMRAAQTIKLFNQETDRQAQWLNKLANSMNKNIQLGRWTIRFDSINHFLFGIENIVIVFLAATAVIDNMFTIGMLYAFMSYKSRFISAMDSLIIKWIEFKMLGLHFDRLADIVFTKQDPLTATPVASHLVEPDDPQAEGGIGHTLELDSLSFQFNPMEQPLFSNLNLNIESGSCVAIVGPSGCGKTTLLKCMMGLLSPTNGQIKINRHPLRETSNYRNSIAAVMQDDHLFSGSIAENIACFSPHIEMQRITWAAKVANVHQDIMSMGMQYNTLVGDMGTNLSGGQKQRILLARALYKQPKILFLDEATSHLDIGNESIITQQLVELPITRVIVAHRLETIAKADTVYQLVEGSLHEVDAATLINPQP